MGEKRKTTPGTGKKRKTMTILKRHDEPSSDTYDFGNIIIHHFIARIRRFVRLLGIIQRIYELIKKKGKVCIPRNKIVLPGASRNKDCKSSGEGDKGIEAAHIVRALTANDLLEEPYRTELIKQLARTHKIKKWANLFHLIGGIIDLFQEYYLTHMIDNIDFHNMDHVERTRLLLERYIELFRKFLRDNRNMLDEVMLEIILDSIQILENMNPKELHLRGVRGYRGTYLDPETYTENCTIWDCTSDTEDEENADDEKRGSCGGASSKHNDDSDDNGDSNQQTNSNQTSKNNDSSSSTKASNSNQNNRSTSSSSNPNNVPYAGDRSLSYSDSENMLPLRTAKEGLIPYTTRSTSILIGAGMMVAGTAILVVVPFTAPIVVAGKVTAALITTEAVTGVVVGGLGALTSLLSLFK